MGKRIEGKIRVIPYNGVDREYTLDNVIPSKCVVCGMRAVDLQDAVSQLVRIMRDEGCVSSHKECVDAIMRREQAMPTMLEYGIHFPHARTSAAMRLASAVALCNFTGVNGRHFIVLTVAPEDAECPYMQYIGYMASRLYALDDKEQMLGFASDEELRNWLLEN